MSQLEIVSLHLGVDGSHGGHSAPGSSEHVSSLALSPEPWTFASEKSASQSVGDTQTVHSSLLAGAASQLNMGQCTGAVVVLPGGVIQRLPGRLGSHPRG